MRATIALISLLLVLAACGSSKPAKSNTSASDGPDFTMKPRDGEASDKNAKTGTGSKAGTADGTKSGTSDGSKTGTGDSSTADQGKTTPAGEGRVDFTKPLARCTVEGKETNFPHVLALWDVANHTVRVVASSQAIPESAWPRLRNGEPLEGEIPHMMLSWVLEEGAQKLSIAGAENYFYDFHWLTSLSPMSLRNIGKEAVRELSGNTKPGEKVRVVIEFRSENVKDAPQEKIHFDFVQELELK